MNLVHGYRRGSNKQQRLGQLTRNTPLLTDGVTVSRRRPVSPRSRRVLDTVEPIDEADIVLLVGMVEMDPGNSVGGAWPLEKLLQETCHTLSPERVQVSESRGEGRGGSRAVDRTWLRHSGGHSAQITDAGDCCRILDRTRITFERGCSMDSRTMYEKCAP